MSRPGGNATDAAVGMMDGAYFTSRSELLEFFNELLDMSLTKIEQTATGAVACQLVDYIFPKSIPMKRVNWEAKSDYEYIENYKLLQKAFNKHRIQKHVDVDRLIRAKYQDNLEFCQWLKAFYDQASPQAREDYDPVAVRAKGKGGTNLPPHFSKGGGGRVPKTPGGRPSSGGRPTSRRSEPSTKKKTIGSGAGRTSRPLNKDTTGQGNGANHRGTTAISKGASQDDVSESIVADANLMKNNSDLMSRNSELELTLHGIEKERDFYFEKLRYIEVMLQVHQEKQGSSDPDALIKRIFKVLYATSDDNIEVDENGQLVGDVSDGEEDLLHDDDELTEEEYHDSEGHGTHDDTRDMSVVDESGQLLEA